jgi:AcrR family transcriptional regulator
MPKTPVRKESSSLATADADEPVSSSPSERPEPPERLRKGRTLAERRAERRAALLEAGLELFGTRGFAASSVEEICRTAYVSTRNFYEEFDNREALLVTLGDVIAMDAYTVLIDAVVEPGDDYARREAHARIGAIVHALLDDPRVARVAFIESRGVSPVHEARRRDTHKLFARYVMGLGDEVSGSNLWAGSTGETYALGLVGAINEVLGDWVLRDDQVPMDELIANLTEFFLLMREALYRGHVL